jgi:hypothetical protein
MAKAAIEVKGLDTTLRALSIIDPGAMKALRVGFKDAATPILDKAKAEVANPPVSGWGQWKSWRSGRDLSWNGTKVRRGLASQVTMGRRNAGLRLVNRDPAGAIWETAGSKMDMRTTRADRVNQSRAFNQLANGRDPAPRLLVGTWKQEKGIKQTYIAVGSLIKQAEARVQEAMR